MVWHFCCVSFSSMVTPASLASWVLESWSFLSLQSSSLKNH
jgi:hypothetical protein